MSWVYFIRPLDEYGLFKIGFTAKNPYSRLSALQTGYPGKLELYAYAPGSMADEHAIHARLAHCHVYGEWFRGDDVDQFAWAVLETDSIERVDEFLDEQARGYAEAHGLG